LSAVETAVIFEILIIKKSKIIGRTKIIKLKQNRVMAMTIHVAAMCEQSRVYSAFVRDEASGQDKRRDFVSS